MKSGRSLVDLAAELERQSKSKRDFIADTRKLSMIAVADAEHFPGNNVRLEGVNGGMALRTTAHAQLAATLQIPKPYYDRMLAEAPDLLSRNVNQWLERQPAKKLIRTLDGSIRAILSASYRPLDNFDLAEAVLPKLIGLGAQVISSEVTESRLYLKATTDRISAEVKVGQRIQAGAVVSNSEIGQGTLRLQFLDYNLACLNGMIRETVVKQVHLGRGARGQDVIEDAREYFRDETRQADDKAFFLKIQDATASIFNQERFTQRMQQYSAAAGIKIEIAPEELIEVTAKRFGFNDTERSGIMRHLIEGGDLSVWGLANAVTRTATDCESYDRATELEALGGQVIELPASAWRVGPASSLALHPGKPTLHQS